MRLRPEGGRWVDAIAFRQTDNDWPAGQVEVEAVYRLEVNEFRGSRKAQMVVQAMRVV